MQKDKPPCAICSRFGFDVKARDNHHILYEPIEITVPLCWLCHRWVEGSSIKFNKHPLFKMYGNDKNGKCLAVLAFHEAYVSLVEERIQLELGKAGLTIIYPGEGH